MVRVYNCGNFSEAGDPPETCPYCGALEREEEPDGKYNSISVTCPGWYEDGKEP